MVRLVRASPASCLFLVATLWLSLGAFTAWDVRTEMISVRTQTETLADALAARTRHAFREASELASVVAWHVQRAGVAVPLDEYVDSGLFKLGIFERVDVLDPDGILRASTTPGFTPMNLSDREYFKVHVDDSTEQLYIGKTVVGRKSGEPTIKLSRRINDPDGKFLGVVVLSMAPTRLTELYDTLRIGKRAAIAIVGTDDFSMRARRSGAAFAMNVPLSAGDPLRNALSRSPRGQLRYHDPIDGIKRMVSFQRLPNCPIAAVVGFSARDYLQAFLNRTMVLFAAGLVLTLVIIAAEAWRTRLLRQVEESARRERDADHHRILKAQRIESLFAAIPDAAIGLSAQGDVDGYNPHLLELLGWTTQGLADATPERLAAAFFRHDRMQDRDDKAARFAAMFGDGAADGTDCAVFRVETPQPVVYELRVERRNDSSTGTIALIRDITAQSRISDSERDLDSTLHAIGDAVVSVDAKGRIERMNAAAERFSGWSPADAVGRPHGEVFRLTSLATGARTAVPIADVVSTGRLIRLAERYALTSLDRKARKVAISAAPIRGGSDCVGGRGDCVSGVVVVLRDVSREYASEQALTESEARYRQLITQAPYGVIVGQNQRVKFANPKAIEILGARSAHQIVGRHALDFRPPEYAQELQKNIERLEKDRRPVAQTEEKWLRLDGSMIYVEIMAVPYEVEGEPGALVMFQDITQRKEAEIERDRLFALSLDLTCVAEPGGHFKRVNPAFTRVLGWSAEELLSRPYLEFIHPDDRVKTIQEVDSHRDGAPIDHLENRYLCKDGSFRWLSWNATHLDGVTYATARDVTETRMTTTYLEQARAEAEASSRAKSSFLATMSHEIRTPMNGVIGMSEVLARTRLTRDQSDMVGTIRDSANSLLTIIDDILDFSKIEAGRLEIEWRPVAIVDLVENVFTSLMPVAKRAGVALDTHIAADVPKVVLSDDTRLRQLLYNLVGNAIKFSGGRPNVTGSVSLRLELSGAVPAQLCFEVTDDGIGMSAQTLNGLFTPFSQAEVSTTRRFGGTGLGLAICRRLVDLMGGDLSVISALGEGSTFMLRLPLRLPESDPSNEFPELDTGRPALGAESAPVQRNLVDSSALPVTVAQAREDGRMILVAEDDEINQKVILRQLGLLGYVAEIAGDGREALELWRSNHYALLLTDLHMPQMDGYELAYTIRREEPEGTRLPIIALTANAIRGEAARATVAGMDGYLTKPLQLNRLQNVLEKHFKVPRRADANKRAAQTTVKRSGSPVDIEVLKSIVGDDVDAVRELLGDYLASVQVLSAELRTYCVQGLGREAGAVAHKMKSSSRSVGAVELGNLCAELENAGKAGDLQALTRWVGKFDDALAAVEAAIGRLLETNQTDGP